MKPLYERENLTITEFDTEDVIATSGMSPTDPTSPSSSSEWENTYIDIGDAGMPGNWF